MVSIHGAGDPADANAPPAERLPLLAAAAAAAAAVVVVPSAAFRSAGEKKASSSATDVSFGARSGNRPSLRSPFWQSDCVKTRKNVLVFVHCCT